MRPVGVIIALLAVACVPALPASAAIHLVYPDGSGDFPTIQDAVDASADGDVIELGSGRFTGLGNHDVTFAGKAITVRSRTGDPLDCVIDCQGSEVNESHGFIFDSGEGPDSRLEGVTITDGYLADG